MPNDIENLEKKLRSKVKRTFLTIFGLCLAAFIVPYVALHWRPQDQQLETWFPRSGSLTTAFAVIAQVRNNGILEKIVGTCFAESWKIHNEYKITANIANMISAFLVVYGTVIWGYGDLIITSKAVLPYLKLF